MFYARHALPHFGTLVLNFGHTVVSQCGEHLNKFFILSEIVIL